MIANKYYNWCDLNERKININGTIIFVLQIVPKIIENMTEFNAELFMNYLNRYP